MSRRRARSSEAIKNMGTETIRRMRLLHLEDNENDLLLVAETLRLHGLRCDVTPAKSRDEFVGALKHSRFDLIISDFTLPSYDGMSALSLARELQPETPFIFFSGTIGEEAAAETLKNGAMDYVLKQHPARLAVAIHGVLRSVEESARRRLAEEKIRELEEQFLRAQRLESLGALISGIAHDLNNALVPLLVGVQMIREHGASPELEGILNAMEVSVRRGADMAKQVLTFARGGVSDKTVIQPRHLVEEIGKIITVAFPKSIQCFVRADKNSWPVSGQFTQLHQVLMNLCVNARDAMPSGGTLTLTTRNVTLTETDATRYNKAKPGNYVRIAVQDTGTGIAPDKIKKIFEPFYTTKANGKGTGLGLSTSLSIVKNHGGFMAVQSDFGRGSEFQFFLPAAAGAPTQAARKKVPPPFGAGEKILVVDDEEGILAITKVALENYGYKVLTATSGAEALTLFAENPAAVHLVITDLDMPFMNGLAMIESLRKIQPDVKIIIASGSENELENMEQKISTEAILEKPFTTESLLEVIHKTLARQ
jgi:signal transduction histidine kinase